MREVRKLVGPDIVLFTSVEPLIEALHGEVDVPKISKRLGTSVTSTVTADFTGIDWAIIGGESASDADRRDMDMAWFKEALRLCRAAGLQVWSKQDSGYRNGLTGRISPNDLHAELPLAKTDSLRTFYATT